MSGKQGSNNKEQGLTLLELIVVVAIIAILALFGFPALDDFQSKQRVAAHFEALTGFIRVIKSEAEARSTTFRVVISGERLSAAYFDTSGGASPPSTNCTGGGWITYPDSTNPRTVVIPAREATLSGPGRLCLYRDSHSSSTSNAPYTYTVTHPSGNDKGSFQLQVNQPTSFITRWRWANNQYNQI